MHSKPVAICTAYNLVALQNYDRLSVCMPRMNKLWSNFYAKDHSLDASLHVWCALAHMLENNITRMAFLKEKTVA